MKTNWKDILREHIRNDSLSGRDLDYTFAYVDSLINNSNNIHSICDKCAQIFYPPKVTNNKDAFMGITVHTGICPICHKTRTLVPLDDYWYAITKNPMYAD
jgi:hypothetical protein